MSEPTRSVAQAGKQKLVGLQALRGVAASLVVLHHFVGADAVYGQRNSWLNHSGIGQLCACGVDLFFVISGFIMMYTTENLGGLESARSFLVRRSKRIYPLYWIGTTLVLLLWKSGVLFRHAEYRPIYVLGSYLLWPVANGSSFHPVLDQGWTLSFEMLFYVLFACAIATVPAARRVSVVGALLLLCMAVSFVLPAGTSLQYLLGSRLLLEFLLGMLVAVTFGVLHSRLERSLSLRLLVRRVLPGLCLLSLLASTHWGTPDSLRSLVWGVPSFGLVLAAVCSADWPFERGLGYVGDASYSIYLGHFLPVAGYASLVKLHVLPGWLPADVSVVVGTLITILLTLPGYRYVELPVTRYLMSTRRRVAVSEPEPSPA